MIVELNDKYMNYEEATEILIESGNAPYPHSLVLFYLGKRGKDNTDIEALKEINKGCRGAKKMTVDTLVDTVVNLACMGYITL